MYYPYLRAKQFELKALREFAEENPAQKAIVPIIEPVKQQMNGLNLAIPCFIKFGMLFALILNPKDGDYKHKTVRFDALDTIPDLLENKDKWIPAFVYNRSNTDEIRKIISQYKFTDVMIIFHTCIDAEDENAIYLIKDESVSYVVNSFGTTVSRRIKRSLEETNKKIIRIDDCFNTQKTNSDYATVTDELFSEEVFYYHTDEHFNGFSDYTALPKEYIEGGMLPKALVIHLTYRKNDDQIYVHHFVSDSNDTNANIRGKFREAAKKIEPFFQDKNKTKTIIDTINLANKDDGYPGLGYLKKLSVKNHLELISDILSH